MKQLLIDTKKKAFSARVAYWTPLIIPLVEKEVMASASNNLDEANLVLPGLLRKNKIKYEFQDNDNVVISHILDKWITDNGLTHKTTIYDSADLFYQVTISGWTE